MFESESEFQLLVHENPEIITSGIPEISPQFCPDTPSLISLGREIPLNSGPIDNLYLDINAVITFVECKRYNDGRIKREVYAQAINYAADLQAMLLNYSGSELCDEFFRIVSSGRDSDMNSFDDLINRLSNDEILSGKHLDDWKSQFISRLEYNIKTSVCRIVIACAPSPDNVFAYSTIRNLMQIMSFSDNRNNPYDLILMDIRQEGSDYISKIIWRNYSSLPQIPLLAHASRDNSAAIEKMRNCISDMPVGKRATLDKLTDHLQSSGLYLVENTNGFALYSTEDKKSLYTQINVESGNWYLTRHQIREGEPLYLKIQDSSIAGTMSGLGYRTISKKTGKGEQMYDIVIDVHEDDDLERFSEMLVRELRHVS